MRIKQIAEEAIRTGRLERVMEGQLFDLFEQNIVDETDLEAADRLIHLLLDGKVERERTRPFEWLFPPIKTPGNWRFRSHLRISAELQGCGMVGR